MPYPRALFATDFSDDAAHAARFAVRLLQPGARKRFVHVLPEPDPREENEEGLLDARREEAYEAVVAWVAKHVGLARGEFDVAILEGPIVEGLAVAADEFEAPLVVVGARGESRLARTLLGTKSRGVVRRIQRDVLVGQAREPAASPLSTVLVATDFYEPAKLAARRALDLAQSARAEIVACHVISQDRWRAAVYDAPSVAAGRGDAPTVEKASREMLHAFNAAVLAGAAREVVRRGRPAQEVADAAVEAGADLVLVGTHGPGLLERAVLGSVAESIVEASPVPVLVVRT